MIRKISHKPELCPEVINYIHNIVDSPDTEVLDFGRRGPGIGDEFLKQKQFAKLHISNQDTSLDNNYQGVQRSYQNIICHRFLHTTADYNRCIQQLFKMLSQRGSLFLSARSTDCQEYTNRNKYIQNNVFENNFKYIKFFMNNEINQLVTNAGFAVIEDGAFTEISKFSGKENTYKYVIAVK